MTPFTKIATLAAATTLAMTVAASAEKYVLDPSHSQVVFTYNHLGFSTTTGMFSGFEGEIDFNADDPATSSVSVSLPVSAMFTGWEARDDHFETEDFFGIEENDTVTFVSTSIEVTGEDTAEITGDLTMNGVTKEVVLDAKLNTMGMHPMEEKEWAGFNATTTVLRSDFDMGMFAPYVSDEVQVAISIEAMKAE
ncbi:YceI family protein [Tropicimonas isoalkanivorans]|uniref:Polyisoprenoid-binding protein YceI n=1 Tax=Tropicimonas isoalkanivorans TaxID=441112 RepID=A0A1I1LIT4_9RHOB|nr:YceI family protein [Tropicimonas isoalkanivorans]SFC72866.1 Polyisoprenoid-binding protein YceI [Tropicimonas isoalkanivorans]